MTSARSGKKGSSVQFLIYKNSDERTVPREIEDREKNNSNSGLQHDRLTKTQAAFIEDCDKAGRISWTA